MKKSIIILLLLLAACPARAIFKEQDLNRTVYMLRLELEGLGRKQAEQHREFEERRNACWQSLQRLLLESEELALVLYSQQQEYLFGMAHSCRQVAAVYREFNRTKFPVDVWRTQFDSEIKRYDGMLRTLHDIPDRILSPQGLSDRTKAVAMAEELRGNLIRWREALAEDQAHYDDVARKMNALEQYTETEFTQIRDRIFLNGGASYFQLLGDFGASWREFAESVSATYGSGQSASSDWVHRVRQIVLAALLTLLVSAAIFYLAVRFWPSGRTGKWLCARTGYVVATGSLLTLSLAMLYMNWFVLERNVFLVMTRLMVEYTWLLSAILLSITIRLKPRRLRAGLRIYMPMMILGALMIFFRIVFVPVAVVRFVMPPFLLVITLVQLHTNLRRSRECIRIDRFYGWISLVVLASSTVIAWVGYRFMALQLIILWITMLAGLLSLTCVNHFLELSRKKHVRHARSFRETWFYVLMQRMVMPLAGLGVVLICCLLAAHIFDMGRWVVELFNYCFIDLPNVARISLSRIVGAICLAVVIYYVIYMARSIVREIFGSQKASTGSIALLTNLGTIFVWGIYAISVVLIFEINNSGLVAAVGGMSVGIGFAMKDTIDNLICGLALMAGRIHLGDMIECDGVRGRVVNINYQSSIIETVDGSTMAFLNNQLFAKNFKNLTRNHGYEMGKIVIGVAYGTDVQRARTLILEAIEGIESLAPNRQSIVQLAGFGDSSVDLNVIVWVPVNGRGSALSAVREAIYDSFNRNGISIPFPQCDVHVNP